MNSGLRRSLTVLVLVGTCFPTALQAQGRIALEAHGGGALPLSAYVHNGVRTVDLTSDFEGDFVPRLVDQRPDLGFDVGLALLWDDFELRYQFHLMNWGTEVTTCTGSTTATELPETLEVEDATVDYDCSSSSESDLGHEGLDPLQLNSLALGYRIVFREWVEQFQPFIVVSAGPAMARRVETHLENQDTSGRRFAAYFGAGVGAQVPVGDLVSLAADVRYNLFLTGPEGSYQSATNRSFEAGEGAAQAALDAFHFLNFSLAVQVNLR